MKFEQGISEEIFNQKYMINGEETPEEALQGIALEISSVEKTNKLRNHWEQVFFEEMISRRFIPGGRILANARPNSRIKNYGNCYVIPIEDHLPSIYQALAEDSTISGMGGGVGFNCSSLRPKNAPIEKGGSSSGPISFLEVFNTSAQTIRNGGGRRSAHITIMDISHPDIEEFITYKQGDGNKKLQSFNISVGISQAFIDSLEIDADWNLEFNGKIYKTLRARDLFNKLAEHSFIHNEPGMLFYPNIDFRNAGWYLKEVGTIRSTNPCGEIPLPAYGVCNLSSVNLSRFVAFPFTPNARFEWSSFKKTVGIGIRFSDNVIDAMTYPLPAIEKLQKNTRRVGLGITGLADAMLMLGIDYGSPESVQFAEQVGRYLQRSSIEASCALAKEKGQFKLLNRKSHLETPMLKRLDTDLRQLIMKNGIRNIALNDIAPVGTGSLSLGENCSSGIEPIFATSYTRKIRTGNGDETRTEEVIDYACMIAKNLKKEITVATAESIDPFAAMNVQQALQKYLDSAISKTYNLPSTYTLADFKTLLLTATRSGLVGFTSYNPKGSLAPILSAKKEDEKKETIKENHAPKRPKELPAKIYTITVKGQKYIVILGMLEGQPYECFVSEYTKDYEYAIDKEGIVKKIKKGHYSLIIPNGEDTVVIDNISVSFNPDYEATSRLLSIALRHGAPVEFIVEQLNKSGHFGSWGKTVAQVLKKTIREGKAVNSSATCPACGSSNLFYSEGCMVCKDCGGSKCG